jgi:hypothetical protein
MFVDAAEPGSSEAILHREHRLQVRRPELAE